MTVKQQLESILSNKYETEDGDDYQVELLEGMNDQEIDKFKSHLPNNALPNEIEELLRFSKGFDFLELDEVRFDAFGQFGFEEMFPYSIQLASDGFGNFWILDIDTQGNWNAVYFICHNPAVVVKHSENLSEFIKHVDEFGLKGEMSNLDIIHEKTVFEIWNNKLGVENCNKNNLNLSIQKDELPDNIIKADLTNKPIKSGFPWGIYGPNTKVVRPSNEPNWVLYKKEKKGFFSRIFGSKG